MGARALQPVEIAVSAWLWLHKREGPISAFKLFKMFLNRLTDAQTAVALAGKVEATHMASTGGASRTRHTSILANSFSIPSQLCVPRLSALLDLEKVAWLGDY